MLGGANGIHRRRLPLCSRGAHLLIPSRSRVDPVKQIPCGAQCTHSLGSERRVHPLRAVAVRSPIPSRSRVDPVEQIPWRAQCTPILGSVRRVHPLRAVAARSRSSHRRPRSSRQLDRRGISAGAPPPPCRSSLTDPVAIRHTTGNAISRTRCGITITTRNT